MTEDTLKDLPLDTLFDLEVQNKNELLEIMEKRLKYEEDEIAIGIKKKKVELLRKVIVAKRAEFSPG
jgi:hypothetical protein